MDTLASLFPLEPSLLKRQLREQVLAGNAWLESYGKDMLDEVAAAMVQRLPEALDQRLDVLIISAFRAQPPLLPASEAAEELRLPLQRLHTSHEPRLQLQVDGRLLLEAVLAVSVELMLRDWGVRLREGRPVALRTGPTSCSGILMLGSRVLACINDQPLRVPAVLRLDLPPSARIAQ